MVGVTGSARDDNRNSFVNDSSGNAARNVVAEIAGGTLAPTGLSGSPVITTVVLNDSTWTTITLSSDFNTVAIQNRSGFTNGTSAILINGDSGASTSEGYYIPPNGEFAVDILGTSTIVAIAEVGAPTITIMGIA